MSQEIEKLIQSLINGPVSECNQSEAIKKANEKFVRAYEGLGSASWAFLLLHLIDREYPGVEALMQLVPNFTGAVHFSVLLSRALDKNNDELAKYLIKRAHDQGCLEELSKGLHTKLMEKICAYPSVDVVKTFCQLQADSPMALKQKVVHEAIRQLAINKISGVVEAFWGNKKLGYVQKSLEFFETPLWKVVLENVEGSWNEKEKVLNYLWDQEVRVLGSFELLFTLAYEKKEDVLLLNVLNKVNQKAFNNLMNGPMGGLNEVGLSGNLKSILMQDEGLKKRWCTWYDKLNKKDDIRNQEATAVKGTEEQRLIGGCLKNVFEDLRSYEQLLNQAKNSEDSESVVSPIAVEKKSNGMRL